ncbi:MAG: tripartite tricarboxylate transporter TctB family protein [Pseudomonadota bacterium]
MSGSRSLVLHLRQNLVAGIVLIVIGAAVLWLASDYRVGTLRRLGPGFFPLLLGAALVVVGLVLPFAPDADRARRFVLARSDLRAAACVLGGILVFVPVLEASGVLPASFLATLVVSFATPHVAFTKRVVAAAAVALICALLFVQGLGMPLPLLWR